MTDTHFHQNERGMLIRCYHVCKHWLSPGFLAGWIVASTITFGPEHGLWEKIWPYYLLTHWIEGMPLAPMWFSIFVNIIYISAIAAAFLLYAKRHDHV